VNGPGNGSGASATLPSEVSDEALIERLGGGHDQDALADLYDRYQASMYGLALRITQDPALAQDAVQEAFLGVWRNAGRYVAGRASVRTWIMSIVHHRAIDLVRRRRPTTDLVDVEPTAEALRVADVWPEVARAADARAVRAAMDGLPATQRAAIELAYFAGLTQSEIAQREQIPLGTVKSRVRLGLESLRRGLEGSQ
jgi:RNA polymerase sigma-70 factor, ECF subfamily